MDAGRSELNPVKDYRSFLNQVTLPSLLCLLIGSWNGFKRGLRKQYIAYFTSELK